MVVLTLAHACIFPLQIIKSVLDECRAVIQTKLREDVQKTAEVVERQRDQQAGANVEVPQQQDVSAITNLRDKFIEGTVYEHVSDFVNVGA